MSIFGWCSRRVGGLGMIALVALCYWVISQEFQIQRHRFKHEQPDNGSSHYFSATSTGAGIWTYVFAYYCLFVHILVSIFPLRACWSVWNFTRALKRSAQSSTLSDLKKLSVHRRNSYTSTSSSETLVSGLNGRSSSTTSEAGDIEPELYTDGSHSSADHVIHAVIIPNYKEEPDTLRETLEVLASHPRAHDSYDVSYFLT